MLRYFICTLLIILVFAPWQVQSHIIPVTSKVIKRYVVSDKKVTSQVTPRLSEEKKAAISPLKRSPIVVVKSIKSSVLIGDSTKPQTPLLINTPMGATKNAVSPLGEWLGSKFSWIDSTFSLKSVKPWQKATLAKPAMLPGGVSPVVGKFASKIFISKEASLGGDGVAGGGCGCK
jgi:hypothetical protein